jgi:hypothetical protein
VGSSALLVSPLLLGSALFFKGMYEDGSFSAAMHRGKGAGRPFESSRHSRDQLLPGEVRRVDDAVGLGRQRVADGQLMVCQGSAQSRPDPAALPGPSGQRDELDSDARMRQANGLGTRH